MSVERTRRTRKKNINFHRLTHPEQYNHDEDDQSSSSNESVSSDNEANFICPSCKDEFPSASELDVHFEIKNECKQTKEYEVYTQQKRRKLRMTYGGPSEINDTSCVYLPTFYNRNMPYGAMNMTRIHNIGIQQIRHNENRIHINIPQPDGILDFENNHYESESSSDSSINRQGTFTCIIRTSSLFLHCQIRSCTVSQKEVITLEQEAYVRLEELLRKENASLGLFEKIQDWNRDHGRHIVSSRNVTRETFYKKLALVAHGEVTIDMKPKRKVISLPSGGLSTLYYFSPKHQIFSILADNDISTFENTIFKFENDMENSSRNPFHLRQWSNRAHERVGEVNTCLWYRLTYDDFINMIHAETGLSIEIIKSQYILVPVMIFMDATTIARSGSSNLEPVVITIGILDQDTRNKSQAWRHIAFNPSIQEKGDSKDYQHTIKEIVDIIMHDIKENLYEWEFERRDGTKLPKVYLKFEPMLIICDTDGGEKLCGKYTSPASKALCRDCNIPKEKGDDPFFVCKIHTHQKIQRLKESGNTVELKRNSFHHYNSYAFKQNIFGSSPLGIYGATPIEPLHMIFGGIADRIYECLKAKLGDEQYKELDKRAVLLAQLYNRQSSSSQFKLLSKFHMGLALKGNVSSNEKVDRIFLIYLVFGSLSFKMYIKNKGIWKDHPHREVYDETDYNDWLLLLERTYLYCRWVTMKDFPIKYLLGKRQSVFFKCIQNYLHHVKTTAKRSKGDGFKLPKFHMNLHLPMYIALYGSPNVFTTETTERHHIKLTKEPARLTQQRDSTIIKQSTERVFEANVLSTFMQKMSIEREIEKAAVENILSFKLTMDYVERKVCYEWLIDDEKRIGSEVFPKTLSESLFLKLKAHKCETSTKRIRSIKGYTNLKYSKNSKEERIRAHPWFYNNEWYQWIEYDWGSETLPAKVYCMLDYSTVETIETNVELEGWNEMNLERTGIFFLIHSARRRIPSNVPHKAGSRLMDVFEMERKLQIVPFHIERVDSVFVCQDWDGSIVNGDFSYNQIPNMNIAMVIRNVDDMHEVFVESLKTNIHEGQYTFNPNTVVNTVFRNGRFEGRPPKWSDVIF